MFIDTLLTNPIFFCRVVIILIASICLHELAHGWIALRLGDDTPRRNGHLTFNPAIHLSWDSILILCLTGVGWGRMPTNLRKFRDRTFSNLIVTLAGPLMNLSVAIVMIGLINLMETDLAIFNIFSFDFLFLIAQINLLLFLFNLLPIPPLDGFHIFCHFFPSWQSLQKTPLSLFALVLLVLNPTFSTGVVGLCRWVVRAFVG